LDWKLVHWAGQECGNNSDNGCGSNEDYDQLKTGKRKKILKIRALRKEMGVLRNLGEQRCKRGSQPQLLAVSRKRKGNTRGGSRKD
jgi:hypothetical protein